MKREVLVLALGLGLFGAGITYSQEKPKPSGPELSATEKVAILTAQKQILTVANQIQQLQQQYTALSTQQQTASKTMNDLIAKAEQAHPGYKLNIDTLEFTAPPPPAKTEEPKK